MSPSLATTLRGTVVHPMRARLNGERSLRHVRATRRFLSLPAEAQRDEAARRLRAVLVHAWESVPFHRERMRRVGFRPASLSDPRDLAALPTLSRWDVFERADDLVSAPYRRRTLVRATSGGTTSAAVTFFQTREAIARKDAAALVLRERMGWRLGAREAFLWGALGDLPPLARGAFARARAAVRARVVEGRRWLAADDLSPERLDEVAAGLSSFRPDVLQAYPSAADLLARRLLERGEGLAVPLVVLTAEPVPDAVRRRVAEALSARVATFYGARECGWIASESAGCARLHVNAGGVHVEADAEGRLLVTDLVNRAMPLLRYEIGDRGRLDPEPCPCGDPRPVLDALEGRCNDVLTLPSGRRVPGVLLDTRGRALDAPGVLEARIVQTAPDAVDVEWVAAPGSRASDLDRFRDRLSTLLHHEVALSFRRVERLRPEPNGKVRHCVAFDPQGAPVPRSQEASDASARRTRSAPGSNGHARDPWAPLAGRVLQPAFGLVRQGRSAGTERRVEAFLSLPARAMRRASEERLRGLLLHARAAAPAWARRFSDAGVDPARLPPEEALRRLPPLSRKEIAARPEDFLSSRHARADLVPTHTGGTTGLPTPFLQTRASVAEKDATARVLRRAMGVPAGARRAYLWGAAQDAPAPGWRRAVLDRAIARTLYLPATGLTDALLDDYADRLRRFRPAVLQGYPSATDLLARRLLARGESVPVPTVVLTAEPVFPDQRERIAAALGAEVLTFYGARECGWIASECRRERRLHVNACGVFLEATDDGRLLVTDLVNRAMPLLRYEIGDRGAIDPDPCPCGDPRPVVLRLEGRATDVFTLPSGRLVPGVVADLRGYRAGEGVLDMQLVQVERGALDVYWVPSPRFRPEDLDALRARLSRWFFGELDVRLHRRERIEPEANGKVRWCRSTVVVP